MAENKINILVTRKLRSQAHLVAGKQSWLTDEIPFIKIVPDESENIRERIHALASQKIGTIFTSINTVKAVTGQLTKVPQWCIFCISGATQNALLQLFSPQAIQATAKNAALLSEEILAHNQFRELVFFCGNRRMDELPTRLRAEGISVKEVEVYQTILTPVHLTKVYQAILFFSPSAVQSFFSINTLPAHTVLFSVGDTTTAALSARCNNTILTCNRPSEEGMIQMITDYFA